MNQNEFDIRFGFGSCMPTHGKAALKSEWRKAQDKLAKSGIKVPQARKRLKKPVQQ